MSSTTNDDLDHLLLLIKPIPKPLKEAFEDLRRSFEDHEYAKQQGILKQLDKDFAEDKTGKYSPEASGFFTKVKDFWDDLKD